MAIELLSRKTFVLDDQIWFSGLSGDHNPMHMDGVAARRTQPGAPVVHGIHTLLWSLDSLAARYPDLPIIVKMETIFSKFIYVGDSVDAVLTHRDDACTPTIFRRKSSLFVAERFAEFQIFYVYGFYDLFHVLRGGAPNGLLSAFYPSSVSVEKRPADMTEYSMAKAAGEVLCADIVAHIPGSRVIVRRLPALPTDQTASRRQAEVANSLEVMLPIVREVQGVG